MRQKDVLVGIEEISILLQYLYMDSTHTVTVKNSIGVTLEYRMDEDLEIHGQNKNFSDSPSYYASDQFSPSTLMAIIAQLKTVPAVELPLAGFSSRWEEIKTICRGNMALNQKY